MKPLLVLACSAALAHAQATTALTIVAPAAPGGGWDQLARTMQRLLESERLATRVQVENIPGAAGTVGLARLVSAHRGDASTLLVTGLVMVGGVAQNASPVTLRDATPVARLVGEYEAIAVPATSPYRSIADLLGALRADPGAVSWGGGSAGGTDQMLVDLVARANGIDPRRVNYVAFSGGGEATTAVLGAQVTAGVSGLGEFADLARAGEVRVLAVSAPERVEGWDAPTLRDAGVDVVLSNWRGVLGPPGLTPLERTRLEALLGELVKSRAWREEIARRGWEDLWLGGEAFGRFAEAESRRVEQLVALRRGSAVADYGARSRLPLWLAIGLAGFLALSLRGRDWRRELAGGSVRGVGIVLGGLALNVLLSATLGFVAASTALFVCTALAFGAKPVRRTAWVALAFSVSVYALFRYGLDVPLEAGAAWRWMAG